jgi:choline dehydrogenase
MNNPDNTRISTALDYLPAARSRENSTLRADCLRAEWSSTGDAPSVARSRTSPATRKLFGEEIVLSGGAIDSRQLLLLSGVGPAEQLGPFGIPLVHELLGVGKSLQDHPLVYLVWKTAPECAERPGDPLIDVVLRYASESGLRNDMWICPAVVGDAVMLVPGILLPFSRGEVRLVSNDVHEPPALDYNYLGDERDRRRLLEAVRLTLDLAEHESFRRVRGR